MQATSGALTRQYAADGYVVVRDAIDPDLVGAANTHIDWLLDRHPELAPEQLGHRLCRDDPFWIELVSDQRLLDLAELFVGPDIALFATHYLCKPPRCGKGVEWHQDGAFWPLEPMNVVTLWLALTGSDLENGCLRVLPGSHRSELAQMRPTDRDSVLRRRIDTDVDEDRVEDLVMGPGDVEVHHPNMVHSSTPNRSDRWRRALTIRYIPTSTRITRPDEASPFLLRGEAVTGLNAYLEPPPFRADDHFRSPAGKVGPAC
ncbi:phytanoyl-CoA dioxygenase [Kribbella sp. ALI-6-A]|uniref:phytanoyl-CoA dioxygenase family protein n=1 Tax=Kribbella sp. ALI-6-A TaxID=1933817 RepID=UPI00097BAC8B|nr:phytanoyl-CoA dioxygenase family protein [Kribbella sp. ALI-6-A]ONI78535.1 phytanoyl-CoA dioxygenase [Kribbella sp. ALI-6-A]